MLTAVIVVHRSGNITISRSREPKVKYWQKTFVLIFSLCSRAQAICLLHNSGCSLYPIFQLQQSQFVAPAVFRFDLFCVWSRVVSSGGSWEAAVELFNLRVSIMLDDWSFFFFFFPKNTMHHTVFSVCVGVCPCVCVCGVVFFFVVTVFLKMGKEQRQIKDEDPQGDKLHTQWLETQ